MVSEHIYKFAGLEILHPSKMTALLLNDDWNDVELGLCFGSTFLWYHWYTSA